MDKIIAFLKEKYNPVGLIVYGSFANGTNNLNSDFDAVLITATGEECHEQAAINFTELDVFVYPKSKFDWEYDIAEFLQVYDGVIIFDEDDICKSLKEKVNKYIDTYPKKSRSENMESLIWLEKMLKRTERCDVEGLYRLHWLLTDSLPIYFDVVGKYYFGPKKSLRFMAESDPVSSEIYQTALKEPTSENVTNWISRIRELLEQERG